MTQEIEINWKRNMLFEAEVPGGKFNLDAAKDFGGNEEGFRPKALMLASLAGCTGMDVASLIKKMKLEVDDFKIKVEANLTEEHPKIYDKVKVTFSFYGENLVEEKLQKAVTLSSERYCGVMAMFRSFAEVNIEVFFIES